MGHIPRPKITEARRKRRRHFELLENLPLRRFTALRVSGTEQFELDVGGDEAVLKGDHRSSGSRAGRHSGQALRRNETKGTALLFESCHFWIFWE